MSEACPQPPARSWTPPVWLRRLGAVAAEHRQGFVPPSSPTERLQLAADLMAFATARLAEEAARRGRWVSALRIAHERAASRLRARG